METSGDWEEEEMGETEANTQELPERTREEAHAFDVFFDQVVHEARVFLSTTETSAAASESPRASSASPLAPSPFSSSASPSVLPPSETRAEGAAFHLGRLKEAGEKLAVIRRRNFSGGEGEDRRRKLQAATLSRLEDQLIQERDRSTQTKRFAFRRKRFEKPSPSTQAAAAVAACATEERARTEAARELSRSAETSQLKETGGQREEEGEEDPCGSHSVCVENRKNEVIVFRPGELRGRELILRDLDQCLLVVAEKIPAARVRRLTACLVFFAEISSSLWLFGCRKSLFFLQCQQLRVHDSRDVAFLLRIFSSPIIERTTEAVFGPQLLELRLPPSVAAAGEENSRNREAAGETGGSRNPEAGRCDSAFLWQDVKDFDWIKKQASPHWTTVPLRPPFDFPLAPLTLQSLETEENVSAPERSALGPTLEPNAPEWFSVEALRAAESAGALAFRAAREAAGDRGVSVAEEEDEI
ncbi:UNVERIFIED_CONTAM: hypothetical protein HHA_264950 [Hammondia hammondi]|eukprot:XP_008887230.1 hypothetical protein HHA_264950 [Hammondia hammondi]